jgi:hypothetical protein
MNSLGTRRLIAWIAMAAMLLGALAPAVSHGLALARGTAPTVLEVCTSSGPRQMVLAPADAGASPWARATPFLVDSPDGQESTALLNHCPFCLPVAERLGPPPLVALHFPNVESGLARPDAQAFFLPTFISSSALPRGPPARA